VAESQTLRALRSVPLPWLTLGALGFAYFLFSLMPYLAETLSPSVPPALANKDFANYWAAGQLIRTGETLDLFGPHETYFAHLQGFFGPDYPWHNWSYPPHYLLALWPLGYVSYEWGALLFLIFTFALYLWALRSFAGPAFLFSLVAVMPFAAHNLRTAQNGFLSAALILGALALRSTKPVTAGILLGCLTFKPQLGILFPFLLLFERNWTMIASAAVTAAILAAASLMAFGTEAWSGYFYEVLPYQSLVMRELKGPFVSMMTSPFGYSRVLGLAADYALLLHAAVALPVLALALTAFWRIRDGGLRGYALIIATLLVTPYGLSYDFGAAAAVMGVMAHRLHTDPSWRGAIPLFAAIVPVIMIPAAKAHVPAAQLALLAVLVLVMSEGDVWLKRLGKLQRTAAGAS
jgi:arabinofuranan 3-O-arabinosyltransferase